MARGSKLASVASHLAPSISLHSKVLHCISVDSQLSKVQQYLFAQCQANKTRPGEVLQSPSNYGGNGTVCSLRHLLHLATPWSATPWFNLSSRYRPRIAGWQMSFPLSRWGTAHKNGRFSFFPQWGKSGGLKHWSCSPFWQPLGGTCGPQTNCIKSIVWQFRSKGLGKQLK